MIAGQKSENIPEGKSRIMLVDDHPIVRHGLTLLINREADLMVGGEAGDCESALHTIESVRPQMVIVDLSLNGPDGMLLLKQIRSKHGALPVLILSMHDESLYAERALRAGANGYVMKQDASERVLKAIRRILAGETYVSERIGSRIKQQAEFEARQAPAT
jgi:DNA-binding NarL/FixJ family response regulator